MAEKPELLPEVVQAIRAFVELLKRDSEECFCCGYSVERMVQVGHSVYAEPCGCRLYKGTIPEAWGGKSTTPNDS